MWIADYGGLSGYFKKKKKKNGNDQGRLTTNELDKKKSLYTVNSVRAAHFLADFFAVIAVKAAYKQRRR